MSIHLLHPKGHPLTWQERLEHAHTESDVVDVVRDYVATLTPQEYASLPEALRPRKIVDANDITTYAFDLVREECHDQGIQHMVQRLAHILSRASIRLSQIMVSEREPDGSQQKHAGDD
jgi:hypothetical protein